MRPEATGKRGVPSAKRAKPERPRDRLGRPLAWDAPNELELEDFDALPLERNHELGRRYVREGRYFPAHEARGSDEAEFFKGLSQMGAGYVHLQRGNRHGAITLLRRAARRIGSYPDPHRGVRTAALAGRLEADARAVEEGRLELGEHATLEPPDV